jgi:hypothetical protein
MKGRSVPFDFKEKRRCQFLDVPQFGKLFGFMGGPTPHKGRHYILYAGHVKEGGEVA